MRWILSVLCALVLVAAGSAAHAQAQSGLTTTACGTPQGSYTVGQPGPIQVDTNGNTCVTGNGSGGSMAVTGAAGSFVDGWSVTGGYTTDVACTTDTATCSMIALLKRQNQRLTAIITTLGSPFQAGGSIGNTSFGISGTLPAFASPPTVVGAETAGSAVTGGGVRIMGSDGTNARDIATDTSGNTVVRGINASSTNGSSTVTTALTFQTLLASSSTRKGCMVQNNGTDVLYIFVGATGSATTATSFKLNPYGTFTCALGNTVMTDNLAITSATLNGATFALVSQ